MQINQNTPDKFLPQTALKVDQSPTDVVQRPPPPANTSLLYFLPTTATVLTEKPSSTLKTAGSGCEAACRSLLTDSRRRRAVTCQPASRSQPAGGAGQEPQASSVLKRAFQESLPQDSLCRDYAALSFPRSETPQMNRGTNYPFSRGRRWRTTLTLGQPVPLQRRVYGSECYRNRFV